LFDNILITDDPEYAKKLAEETWGKHKDVWQLVYIWLYGYCFVLYTPKLHTTKIIGCFRLRRLPLTRLRKRGLRR
jgi:calreticulin